MTRDEAIRVLVKNAAPCFPFTQEIKLHPLCAAEIDSWVELGMLKLDEPKTIEYRAIEALADGRDGIAMSSHGAFACIKKLEAAGLRIVEK